jgi:hypothetical protein
MAAAGVEPVKPAPVVIPGCAFQDIDLKKYGYAPFQNPPDIRSKDGVLDTSINVQYTDPNTTSIAGCPVKLRTYNGELVLSFIKTYTYLTV